MFIKQIISVKRLSQFYLAKELFVKLLYTEAAQKQVISYSSQVGKKVWNNPQTHCICLRVLHGKRFNLLDVDAVVELDEVPSLFLLHVAAGPREASRGRRGAARLRDWQGAAGPHDGAGVSAGCAG